LPLVSLLLKQIDAYVCSDVHFRLKIDADCTAS